MVKSIYAKQKTRGRPATGVTPMVGLRLAQELIERVDRWAAHKRLTRSDAIRQLLEEALGSGISRTANPKASEKATELAKRALERIPLEEVAPAEEQERRKRRLLKGPKEFRDLRSDAKSRTAGK